MASIIESIERLPDPIRNIMYDPIKQGFVHLPDRNVARCTNDSYHGDTPIPSTGAFKVCTLKISRGSFVKINFCKICQPELSNEDCQRLSKDTIEQLQTSGGLL